LILGDELVDKCVIFGKWVEPESWEIVQPDTQEVQNSVEQGYFVREHSSYEEARRWVLVELKNRRKVFGRTMESWLARRQLVKEK
jgi:hypothetical protein